MASSELAQLLARSWLFSELSKSEIDALTGIAQMRAARAKQSVVKKGEPGASIFVVLRGRLKVVTSGLGRGTAFRILGPGELFGEIAVLDGQERSATVTALEPGQLAVIQEDAFTAFLERHPAVSRKLLAVLARRVRDLSQRVEDRALLEAPARLAKCMLGLAERYGKQEPRGLVCNLKLSQSELGELIDATRESVNKLLRTWKSEGILTHEAQRIVVHDLPALRALVRS